jgi:hypothetical protein
MQRPNSLAEPDNAAVKPRAAVEGARKVAPRPITPTDGSVVQVGNQESVYCAACQRWIDCYDGIAPEIVRDRHANLFH